MAGAKKVVEIKKSVFSHPSSMGRNFEIRPQCCCIFKIFDKSFKWPPVIQEIKLIEKGNRTKVDSFKVEFGLFY